MPNQAALRKGLLIIHLWLGLGIGLYLSVVGLTGSILVFTDNLEPVLTPELAYCQPPEPGARELPVSEILARLRRALPAATDTDLAAILMPVRAGGAYRVQMNVREVEKRRVLTVDPYTSKVIGDRLYTQSPLGFIHQLHVFLLLGASGELANGIGGILATCLLGSGLWLWWPATRRQLRARLTIKRKSGVKRLIWDLHHALGFYSYLLLTVVSITGALFVFPQPVQAIIARIGGPGRGKPPVVTPPPHGHRLPVDSLVAVAEKISPEIAISSIYYPGEPNQPFSCYKRSFKPGFLPYVNVFIDPYTAKVLKVADDRTAPTGAKIPRVLSMLHFGLWGGILVKSIYALVGLSPSFLFATGLLMYLRKRKDKGRRNGRVIPVEAA